ncbi:myb-like protein O isoform X3 [Vespula squamosa]|uniref:Myb-like protein O isoform X3 n=1 Tax=Vespula squamosa TaxID=30214 RepID=A0ABD2BS21_VESSQ
MASDLSSGCNEAIEVLDEREEGEISLEDVSSSEEGHLGYGYGNKTGRCINCLSIQHCTSWCTSTKYYHPKSSNRKDTVQEKENRHYAKDSGSAGVKHTASTLQEKNDDLVPISSDSDMEIVGLTDNSKQIHSLSRSRSKKKKKKKRTHGSIDDFVSSSSIDITAEENTLKHDNDNSKDRLSRSHRRDLSPLHRSIRSRLTTKSPSRRYRASMWFKVPLRKSKSPVMRSRSPVLRRSPRRIRSPERSPHRSPTRTISKKMSKNEQLPSSNTCTANVYGNVNKLLKKVRRLDSVRIRAQEENIKNKEHCSSLKEKLSNMMKGMSDNNGNVTNCTKEKTVTCGEINNDADDEEDLALLRQKALETKQKRSDKNTEQSKTEVENKTVSYDDDHDEEDLELRMIALRSAVLKKHQNRVQRGVKAKKHDSSISRSKSPFTQSFLDSIPIPSEKRIDTPPPVAQMLPVANEITHTEDMELDTDIEQEKEKLPYSPTDNITIDIPIDTELLGIQPSDVSFINLNKRISSPPFDNTNNQLEHRALRTGIIENKSYLSNMMNNTSTENSFYDMNPDAPYSPSDSIETSKSDVIITKPSNESISTSQFNGMHCNMMNDISTNETCIAMDISTGQERPYSPTDAPIYDPDLSQTLPLIQTPHFSNNSNLTSMQMMYNTYGNSNILNMHEKSQLQYLAAGENIHKEKHINDIETFITRKQTNSPPFFEAGSISPNDSMLTIDDFPDTDTINSNLPISVSMNLENTESTLNNPIHKITKITEEPLYMHGVPDVTKDINKIPTLINRTLVPATILKSNKQLQQPLPTKKYENHVEPTFKSAEMQPIPIDFNVNTKLSTQFKPMKLTSVIKKPQTILTTPVAFQSCLNDESTSNIIEDAFVTPSREHETSSLKNISPVNSKKAVFINNIDLVPKKKKRTRRNRRRNNNVTQNIKIRTSSENIERSEHDLGASGEINRTMMNTESGLPSSDIEKQTNISDVTVLADFDDARLTKLSQESNPLLTLDENSVNNKTSCNEIQKDNIVQHSTNLESNISSSLKIINDHIAAVTNRRPSLDEDEEALRASLLASLAKRTKSLDNNSCNTSLVTTTATLSCVSTVPSVQKAQQMDTAITPLTHQTVQNDTTLHSLTQSASAYNSGDEKNHTYTVPVSSVDVAKENTIGISTDTTSCSSLTNSGKKRPLPLLKGPSRKFLKKVLIPASTKVVNNAKKYQNSVVQKKLILQKAVSNYNAEKLIDIKPIASVKPCENKWTGNTKIISSDTQRIVINLGSDTESDSEHERLKANSIPMSNSNKLEKRPVLTIPTTEFEKSVDQFLRDVRKKQEIAAANKQTIPLHNATKKNLSSVTSAESKISPTVHTPLAVRHLPVSKQEEYRRLKQQILEREILKLQRSVEIGTSKKTNNFNTSHSTTSDSSSKESLPSFKENPNVLGKFSNLNLQISVKNNNERNIEVKKNKNSSTSTTTPNSADKTNSGKQNDVNLISNSKKASLQITLDPNVRISNEEAPNQNNKKLKTTESNVTLIDTTNLVSENTIGLQDIGKSKIATASLKVLTKDEVNHKLVQIQVKEYESNQAIIVGNKTDLSERTNLVHNKDKQNIDVNKDNEDKISIELDHNKMDKTNNVDSNCTFMEKDERDADISQNEIITDNINSSSTLDLQIEHENVQSKKTIEKNQLLVTSVQDKIEDNTNSDLSNIESSNESDLLLASNNIETNKVANVEELNESITKDVTIELNSLVNLPRIEQVRHLMETEHKLVMKRYIVLDNLAEMSGDLRQWDMERDLQTNFVEEVKKLREQLKVAEEKLRIHRNRINSIGPKVMDAHEKINNGRRECFKLSRICKVLGSKVVGQDYKVPQAGADLLDNKLKEVASHTRQLSKKKVPSIHISEVYKEVVSQKKESELKLMEREIPTFENSLIVEQQNDNHNENNNMIALKDEDNISTSKISQENTQRSSDQEEDEESGRDTSSCETNDTIKHDHYYNRTTTEVVSCIDNNPASKEDCDITQYIETGEAMLKDDYQKKKTIEPYVSMLSHLKVPRWVLRYTHENVNPNGVLCPYELMGICNDGDCQFVHQSVMFCSHHMDRKTIGKQGGSNL